MDPLDQGQFVRSKDPTGFYDLVVDFPSQCRRSLEIANRAALPNWTVRPDVVLLTGLGGSAAGGDFVKAIFDDQGRSPFAVNRDYHLPAFVRSGALVFAASYSGNTEETLSAYVDARRRGANIVAVTSGGQLAQMAQEDGFPCIVVPGGQPPRTALGYMLIPVLVACQHMGLIDPQQFEAAFDEVDRAAHSWRVESPVAGNEAKKTAAALSGKLSLLYGLGGWQWAVAQRWKGQINENGKEMTFTHAFPELCHNEILGWEGSGQQGVKEWVTVLLEGGNEPARVLDRVRLTCNQISGYTRFLNVKATGSSLLSRMLSLAHLGDYVSIYMAALAGRDPAQMDAITRLKDELANLDSKA